MRKFCVFSILYLIYFLRVTFSNFDLLTKYRLFIQTSESFLYFLCFVESYYFFLSRVQNLLFLKKMRNSHQFSFAGRVESPLKNLKQKKHTSF